MATGVLLSHRGVLRIGGEDRRVFLQGLISNDIGLCTPEKPIYAALLTPQGKFLHDLFIYDAGDALLVDCEAARADDLLQRLSTYKLRAKVTLENLSGQKQVWAFREDGAGLPDPRLPALGSRGIFDQAAGFQSEDSALYDRHRLRLGVPEGSRDLIVGKSTLSDGNFDFLGGISWTKGCYVGQELTARMHHRALVKKRMFPVRISGAAPAPGEVLRFKDQDIGEMRSANDDIGLALLNVDAVKTMITDHTALPCGAASLVPFLPEWLKV